MLCLIIRQLYQSENILSISIERDGMLPVSCISHFSWARLLIILAAPATPSTACRWSESSVWAATVRPSPKPPWPQAPHGAGIQFKPAPSLPVTLNCKHRIKYGLHIVTRRHLCMLGLSYQFAVFSRKKFCQTHPAQAGSGRKHIRISWGQSPCEHWPFSVCAVATVA